MARRLRLVAVNHVSPVCISKALNLSYRIKLAVKGAHFTADQRR